MKIFNLEIMRLKFILGTLCIFLLASCSSDNQLDIKSDDNLLIEQGILLPESIFEKGESYVDKHLSSISEAELLTYHNNYIVGQYLVNYGKIDAILETMSEDANLSEVDLTSHLSADQINTVNSSTLNVLPDSGTRGCTPIKKWKWCCHPCAWQWCVVGWWCG